MSVLIGLLLYICIRTAQKKYATYYVSFTTLKYFRRCMQTHVLRWPLSPMSVRGESEFLLLSYDVEDSSLT